MGGRAWAWWVLVLGGVAGARELDPAACSARFDLQRDKIIRTEESREMGARYLSELDVGARTECLRLCCETDACDVFVYEEKGPGSCYLFNCGPPEDFRCKFTAHSNFSSGVLAVSRRLAELQDQEQLAHHERELASLRSVSSAPSAPPTTTTSTTTAAPPPPPPPPQPPSTHPHSSPPSRCSRYQFECRRGGECIAVYNACDGVPQCADGSDEAPELGCPPPPPPPPRPDTPPPPPPPPRHAPQTLKPLQDSMEIGAGGNVGDGLVMDAQGTGDRWPHRLTQAQPQHRYNEGAPSSHIFSHKGGLLQEAENGAGPQYPPFEPPWPRRTWTQQQTGVGSMESGVGWGGSGGYSHLQWGEPEPRRAWPVPPRPPQPPSQLDTESGGYMPSKTMPEIPMVYSSRQQTLRDGPKKGFELTGPGAPPPVIRPPPPSPAPPPKDNTTVKLRQDKIVEAHKSEASSTGSAGGAAAERHHAAPPHTAAGDDGEPHDGRSERPPAAVLLLVLGVVMTGAMGAMLGCRAGAARRRLRRGKPFAHDADYLVNGMYL